LGSWKATNAEFALSVKSKMQDIISDIKGRWLTQIISHSLPFPEGMVSIVGIQNQGIAIISVRCVARTEKTPLNGYIRDDISNADVLGLLTR